MPGSAVRIGPRAPIRTAAPGIGQGKRDVRGGGHRGEQVELLEHEPDTAVTDISELVLAHRADVLTSQVVAPGGRHVQAADDVQPGEYVAVMGPSGSGKS